MAVPVCITAPAIQIKTCLPRWHVRNGNLKLGPWRLYSSNSTQCAASFYSGKTDDTGGEAAADKMLQGLVEKQAGMSAVGANWLRADWINLLKNPGYRSIPAKMFFLAGLES